MAGEGQDANLLPNEDIDNGNAICCRCSRASKRIASSVWFFLLLVLGGVFLVAGKVKTDKDAVSIDSVVIYRFLTFFLLLSIVWMSSLMLQKCVTRLSFLNYFCTFVNHMEPYEPLLPRRLLVGVMFFGLGSSFMTMVEFLEYSLKYQCVSHDLTYVIYYFIRSVFTYVQLYFLYKLTTTREKLLIHGHFLMMLLIAVNLMTWLVTFIHDSAEELESLKGEQSDSHTSLQSFMLNHYGVNLSAENTTNDCMEKLKDLEATAKTIEPYFYTFTMEYCLITAGLLFNVWLLLSKQVPHDDNQAGDDPNALIHSLYVAIDGHEEEAENHEVGTLWRFGFLLGMVCIPIFVGIIFNILFTDTEEQDKLIYVSFQFFFYILILLASAIGIIQLDKHEHEESNSKVDIYLLGFGLGGVIFLDGFILVAAACEVDNSQSIAILLLFTNVTEILCSCVFTKFVYKALQKKLPQEKDGAVLQSAAQIRQVVSFLFVLNICFWLMYTFEVKKSYAVLSLTEQFYTQKVWFYISHIVYPLAVFFHFHGAVCMVEILDKFSKVPAKSAVKVANGHTQHGHGAQGQGAQGQDAQGHGAQGQGAQGQGAQGHGAQGHGAQGQGAQGQGAQGHDAQGQGEHGQYNGGFQHQIIS